MLRENDREERFFDRISFALELPELLVAAIRIVRSKHDETLFGQTRGERFVIAKSLAVLVFSHNIVRHSFQTVLADDNGPALARFEIVRHKKITPGKYVG